MCNRRVLSLVMCVSLCVVALAALLVLMGDPARAAGPWYVAPGGDDGNDCLSPATPCATINGAIGKASSGDTIYVATGTYTGTGDQVVLVDRDVTLSGGWDSTFTTQSGFSTIDGQAARQGVVVDGGVTATVERLTVQSGYSPWGGGGIYNGGTLNLNSSTVRSNAGGGSSSGGGIDNRGTLILNSSSVSDNTATVGGGIYNFYGTVALNNSTVSHNAASQYGGGIYDDGTLSLNNSTVSGNSAEESGGGINNGSGTATLQNTILAGNTGPWSGRDCSGSIGSTGYNLVGSTSGCSFSAGTGDLTDVDAKLGPLEGSPGYHPLLPGSPALDAGSCPGVSTDQRGQLRPVDLIAYANADDGCDMGSYEAQVLDLSAKIVNRTAALPGNLVAFKIDLANGGPTQIAGAQMTDTVPLLLEYVDGSLTATSGEYGYSGGVITWTGSLEPAQSVMVSYESAVSETASIGTVIVNTAVISGGGDIINRSARLDVDFQHVYLPCIGRNYCPDFFDDFSNPASGWDVVDDSYVRTEYLNGEYRVLTKQSGYFYLFRAPTCDRQNYTVEVDARWVGTPGAAYGLIFGLTGGYDQYYLFDMNTDYKQFRLLRRDPGGFVTVVPITDAPGINGWSAPNHLKVTRNGDEITLEANGTLLGTWYDGTIGGLTGAGLVTNPYGYSPTSDARFDNFSMATLPGGGASAQEPGGVMPEEGQLTVPNARRVPAPIDMGW